MKNTGLNKKWDDQKEISCPFAVTKNLKIKNICTQKIHANTIILATFDTMEAAQRWVGVQYLLNA